MSDGLHRKADRVAGDLMSRIVSGELAVGTVLPREADLATHYGVNRSVVREAVKLLEVHRLVRPVRRRGTEVLDPCASLSPEVLGRMLQPTPGSIDRSVLADLLEVRADLDVQMASLAAARRSDRDLAALEALIQRLHDALPDPSAFVAALDDLTLAVARATQNRVFEMLAYWNRRVATELSDVFRTTRLSSPAYVRGVEIFVELIRQRDAEQVAALVRAYHEWAIPRLLTAAALQNGEPLDRMLATHEPPISPLPLEEAR